MKELTIFFLVVGLFGCLIRIDKLEKELDQANADFATVVEFGNKHALEILGLTDV